jgi:hypothetical protein
MRKPLDILYNFHWIEAGEAARASQAYLGFLGAFLASNGLRAMINLRGRPPRMAWVAYETRVCAEHGVAHLDAMLDSRRAPTRRMLAGLFDAFDAAPRPFVVKCSGGQDRTSFAAAMFILHREGWGAMARARAQFARFPYLHFPRRSQRWLAAFPAYARAEAKGRPIGEWARGDYNPEAFLAFLAANGMAGYCEGVWEPWKPPAER